MTMIETWFERELIGDRVYTERNKRRWQTDLRKEEGRQSSNPRRESEMGVGGESERRGCCRWEC